MSKPNLALVTYDPFPDDVPVRHERRKRVRVPQTVQHESWVVAILLLAIGMLQKLIVAVALVAVVTMIVLSLTAHPRSTPDQITAPPMQIHGHPRAPLIV